MKNLVRLYILNTIILFGKLCADSSYGALLLQGNCTTCHFETQEVSAPSLKSIKQIYIKKYKDKNSFVLAMSQWVMVPNIKNALMQDMIKKFGLMPELGYDEESLKQISEYIYKNDFN